MAKFVNEKVVKGKRHITVELDDSQETVVIVNPEKFYQLGGQIEDVVYGHTLTESKEVLWNHHIQKWEAR